MNGTEKSKTRVFLEKVGEALLRLAAFGLFLVIHYVLNLALEQVAPNGMTGVLGFSKSVMYVIFLLIYTELGLETVSIFIPWPKVVESCRHAYSAIMERKVPIRPHEEPAKKSSEEPTKESSSAAKAGEGK